MSQNPRKKTPVRKVASAPTPQPEVEDFEYEEEEQEYESGPDYQESRPVSKPANRSARTSRSDAPERGQIKQKNYRAVSAPPKRDLYPYILGSVIGAAVIGLLGLAYLLGTGNRSAPTSTVNNPVNANSGSQPTQPPGSTTVEPVRMPMADFKALYDDPAKRPLIVDVRANDRYAEGHIDGAVNIPDAETEKRLAELPRDKPIILYCQ